MEKRKFGYTVPIQRGVSGLLNVDGEKPKEGQILVYDETTERWQKQFPQVYINFVGSIINLGGTDWVRWGQNVTGSADSFLLPFDAILVGYSVSNNGSAASVTTPASNWEFTIGKVENAGSITVPNTAGNFVGIYTRTFDKASIDSFNGFPQFSESLDISFPAFTRVSCRSISSGITWTGQDSVVTLYFMSGKSKPPGSLFDVDSFP